MSYQGNRKRVTGQDSPCAPLVTVSTDTCGYQQHCVPSMYGQKVTAEIQQHDQEEAKGNLQTTTHPKARVCRNLVSLPALNLDRLKRAKALVDKAVKLHKVFSIQGRYPAIREALRARGWVEQHMVCSNRRVHHHQSSRRRASSNDDNSNDPEKEQNHDKLHKLMSRLVRNEVVYFYWTNRRNAINTNSLRKEQMTNHFAKAGSFTTKTGLCLNLRNLNWFDSVDPDTFFPRCYKLAVLDERHDFIDDYRRTACTSLLKYIVERDQDVQGERISHSTQAVKDKKKQSKQRSRPVNISQMINSALRVCQEFLDSLDHRDIDTSLDTQHTPTQEEWAEFLDSYYLVVHGGAEIETSEYLVTCCKAMLQKMKRVNPQLEIEGIHNIWIVKPGAKSRGRGIKCANRLDQILSLVDGDPNLIRESKWVVQKYLERPFLIHGTKFDVRQWFLVTDWNPLTVWFYKKCYLRFSTQPYTLDTMDSSVHLCNNSIQKHFRPSLLRHRSIPADNMWSVDQFKMFLCTQDKEAQWETVVVPGMKSAVIHTLQTAQDLIESRKNTFELYGADFMLGRDLCPWLIEINSSPTMAPSTPVTARLCAAVQEDTLRVVLDRRIDSSANTGDFQLIYRQAAVEVPQYVGVNLLVEGFKVKGPCSLPSLRSSSHSVPRYRGPVKVKTPAAEKKLKPLPKMPLMDAAQKQMQRGSATSFSPTKTFVLHLPVINPATFCAFVGEQSMTVMHQHPPLPPQLPKNIQREAC